MAICRISGHTEEMLAEKRAKEENETLDFMLSEFYYQF